MILEGLISGHPNKTPQTGSLHNRHLFLTVQEAEVHNQGASLGSGEVSHLSIQTAAMKICRFSGPTGPELFSVLRDVPIMWVLMEEKLTAQDWSPQKGRIFTSQAPHSWGLGTWAEISDLDNKQLFSLPLSHMHSLNNNHAYIKYISALASGEKPGFIYLLHPVQEQEFFMMFSVRSGCSSSVDQGPLSES